jgi:hypothetical protein
MTESNGLGGGKVGETNDGVSRRQILKQGVVAAGVAWSAPVLMTAPAAAAGTPSPACGAPCPPIACGIPDPPPRCGPDPLGCFCSATIEGDCFCIDPSDVGPLDCETSADCLSGQRCVVYCGGVLHVCALPCPGASNPERRSPTASAESLYRVASRG